MIDIYTDGACSGNPGPGGWAAILKQGKYVREINGAASDTTNNQMELMAFLQALRKVKKVNQVIRWHSDSLYAMRAVTGAAKVKANKSLIREIQTLITAGGHQLQTVKVKGHSGQPENERCDQLAREAAEKAYNEHKQNSAGDSSDSK